MFFDNYNKNEIYTYLCELDDEIIFELKITNAKFDSKNSALLTFQNVTMRF